MFRRPPSMRWRIASSYLVLLVVTLALLALISVQLLRATYLQTLQDGVAGQARLLATLITSEHTPFTDQAQLDRLVHEASTQLDARITVASSTGLVVADSLESGHGSNILDRPEIRDALQQGQGANERLSAATGDNRMYIAVPIGPAAAPQGVVRVGVPLPVIAQAQTQLTLLIASAAVLAGMVTIVLAVVIAQHVTQPLLDLRAMVGRLAAGDLEVQVPIPHDVEVAALAYDVNQMASRLRQVLHTVETERQRLDMVLTTMADGIVIVNRTQEITLVNPAGRALIGVDVTDLHRGLAELKAAVQSVWHTWPDEHVLAIDELSIAATGRSLRAQVTRLPAPAQDQVLIVLQDLTELRRAERSRRMLMSNIAHDLRTPLASLQAIIETLEDGALADNVAAPDFLRRMAEEVSGLTRLVNDVLELSRLESGELVLYRSPSDITVIARRAAQRMAEQAARAAVLMVCELPDELPLLLDTSRIEQALMNVLQNAIAHTPPGGRVTIGTLDDQETVTLWVRDTGVGIAPADLPHIFERLYKGDESRRSSGTGLGLAIVKQLVERHGGHVSAESDQGRGTTVIMIFPRHPHD